MTDITLTPSDRSTLLRRTLQANGTFSIVSGLALVLFSSPIANLLGYPLGGLFFALGLVLIVFALPVFWISTRPIIPRGEVWVIIALDLSWVAGSILLLLSGAAPPSPEGKWAVAILADIVAIFAILQYIGLRRLEP